MTFSPETMHPNWICPCPGELSVVGAVYAAGMRHADGDDTEPAVRRLQIEQFRSMTPTERASLANELSVAVVELSIAGVRSASPAAQILYEVTARRIGRDLADAVHGSSLLVT